MKRFLNFAKLDKKLKKLLNDLTSNRRPKDKIMKKRVVGPEYHIPCGSCDTSYIVEMERGVREAIHIRMEQPTLNKDGGPLQPLL